MKRFFIETYGCQMNKADSASISESLIQNGFIESQNGTDADIVIINTCSVRQSAENRIWGRLGYYKNLKTKKKITLLVAGCMAQRLGKEFLTLKKNAVDIFIGTYFRDRIPGILKNFSGSKRLVFTDEASFSFPQSVPEKENPQKAYVTISYGCNNFCSYCIVPYLRGRERSRNSDDIINEINRLSDNGVVQVTLLGQNVNSYGKDTGDISFAKLLEKISHKTDIKWIKYLSSHPKDFTDDLIEVIAGEEKVSKWIHLAVQSGSNKILERMNRGYTVEYYLRQIEKFKSKIQKINLTTDIIAGFPGETKKDFNETCNVLKQVEFNDAFMYKYNPRKGTSAYNEFKDDVSSEEKQERLTKIIELQHDISRKKRLTIIGDINQAICEKWSNKEKNEILALTKDDIMIIFNGEERDFGKILNLKTIRLKGNTLIGEKVK